MTDNGASGGCDSWAFDTNTGPFPPLAVTSAPVLSVTLEHRCDGPVQVRAVFTALLTPPVGQSAQALAFAQATCTGGGCQVTGNPIPGAVGSGGGVMRGTSQAPIVRAFPMAAIFPDLPAGTYTVDVMAAGLNAELMVGQAHVFGSGKPAPGAGRPASP